MKCINCPLDAGTYEGKSLTICPSCSKKQIDDILRKHKKSPH